jgi:Domain of unknown function (DUF4331)
MPSGGRAPGAARSGRSPGWATPLVNEVLIPLGKKDFWNTQPPVYDQMFASYVSRPELAGLLPALYPGVFPHLAALARSGKPRADLEAILLTGIPAGLIKGFQNHTGSVLPGGEYTVWRDAGQPAGTVVISGGAVASFRCSAGGSAG